MKGLSLACAALCLVALSAPAYAGKPALMLRPLPPHGGPPPARSGPHCGPCPQSGLPPPYGPPPFFGYPPATALGLGLLSREALYRYRYGAYGFGFNRYGFGGNNALYDLLSGGGYIEPAVPEAATAQLPDVPLGPLILVEPFFPPDWVGPDVASAGAGQPRIIYVNRDKTAEHHAGEMPQIIYGDLPARKASGPEIIYGDSWR